MNSRSRTISQICSIFVISVIILSATVLGFDNLVMNGDFDDELNNWNVVESPQFTINVANEKARFNGDGISMFWNINEDINNGTFYQIEKLECNIFNISENEITSYFTLDNTITELITNPTFENETGWYYTEFGNTSYIDGEINSVYKRYDVNSTNVPVSYKNMYAGAIINQSTIVPVSGFLSAESLHKHYIYGNGTINSSMIVENGIYNIIYNETTTESTTWIINSSFEDYVFSGNYVNTSLSTTHTLEVDMEEYNNTVKQTSWDNCYVNISTYYNNGTYLSNIINASENCSWNQINTYTNFNPTGISENQKVYFRTGESENYDGTWSNWQYAGDPESIELISGISNNKYNVTGFGQYSQYKIEWNYTTIFSRPHKCYGASIGGILVSDNIGTASLLQTISKPYTNYTVVEYDQQIILNDILNCNITVTFGNHTLSSYNVSESNGTIESFSFNVSGLVDPMGEYDLNFTITSTFASPNITVVRIPVDVVFALDTSGSMTSGDMDNLKDATKNLIGKMNETDRVAIYTYDGGGSENTRPLLQEGYGYMTSANKTIFNATIDSLTSNGYTCFYDTVGEAVNYTQNNKISGRLEYVIAMTDGESNSDDDWSPEDIWGNITTSDPNDYDSDNLNQSTKGLKGLLEAPCIVYTVGLGITHDSGYPSAPNWSYTPPDPSTGIEYDVWNVATTSPDLTHSYGGKYGINETGEDNTGRYYYTDDSNDLPEIFESLYGSVYISEVSGINSSCIVNIDNVRVLIQPQAPLVINFTVTENNPTQYVFHGYFTDLTLNKTYEINEEGIENITIYVGTIFEFNVTEYSHIGNGVFEFEYIWDNPPPAINSTSIRDSYVKVIDKQGNENVAHVIFVKPTTFDVLYFIGGLILIVLIVLVVMKIVKKGLGIEDNKTQSI